MAEPNREDMERAKIVLDDALPYELDMLDAAARYMQTDEFSKLTNCKTEVERLTCNATIESYWTHARCVMEFFCRRKNIVTFLVVSRAGSTDAARSHVCGRAANLISVTSTA